MDEMLTIENSKVVKKIVVTERKIFKVNLLIGQKKGVYMENNKELEEQIVLTKEKTLC